MTWDEISTVPGLVGAWSGLWSPWECRSMSVATITSRATAAVQKQWDKIASLAPRLAENGRITL